MTGAEYVAAMQKKILSANDVCRYDEKGFCVMSGDPSNIPDLSAVFVFCRPAECAAWKSKLTDKVRDTHISLHVVPYATDPHFIVRGTIGPDWVFVNLWDIEEPPLNIIPLDLEPLRMWWFDVKEHGSGPLVIHRTEKREETKKHLRRAAGGRKGDGRLIFEPGDTSTIYYLLFQSAEDVHVLAERILSDIGLPLRDLFLIADQTRHRLDSGPMKKKSFAEGGSEREHLLKRTEAIAVVEMAPGVVCVSGSQEHHPYQKLVEWARQFESKPLNREHGVRVEVIPCESVKAAKEIGSPYKIWIDYLESRTPPVKEDERVPIGWLEGTARAAPTAKANPPFQAPRRNAAILGARGKGKSLIAFHLLAQYVKKGFTVVFVNYKKASSRKGDAGDSGPREHSELLDFAAVIQQATDTKVIARPWQNIAQSIASDEAARKSTGEERTGSAYYTEFSPGNGVAILDVLQGVVKALDKDIVFCLDEVVTEITLDHNLAADVKSMMDYLFNELRTSMTYVMVLHQNLSQFDKVGWLGFGDDCCYLMTALTSGDADRYNSQFHEGKLPFLGDDVPIKRLEKFEEGRFAFVPPKNLRGHSPIPLEIPKYDIMEKERKRGLQHRLPWDEIDYRFWQSEAGNATNATDPAFGTPRLGDKQE
jgi:hypothetical protein